MWRLRLLGLAAFTVLVAVAVFAPAPSRQLTRRPAAATVLLPLIQKDGATAAPPTVTGSPTPTGTPTRMPTSTPYPTVDINKAGIREGPRPDERPDLRVVAIRALPAYPTAGEPTTVEVVIYNAATAGAPNVLVTLAVDGLPQAEQRADLLPVAETVVRFAWTPAAAGVFALTTAIDPNREFVERDLADNTLAQDIAVAAAAQTGDIAVSGLQLAPGAVPADITTANASGPSLLTAQVKNNGATPAQIPVVFSAGSTELATVLVGPLAPGASTTVAIPVAVPPGAQFAIEVNPRFRSQEPNTANNTQALDLRPAVDLLVDSLSVAGALVEANAPRQVTVSFRIVNAGRDPVTGAFRTRIFPGDLKAGSDDVALDLAEFVLTTNGLPAGATVYAARTVALPVGVDQFEARVDVDIDSAVAETNEGNNSAAALYSNPAPNVGRWISIGPRRMTDSGRHGYPWDDATGRLSAIAIVPNAPNTIYVGAQLSGVWKTTNGGATWQSLTDSLPTLSVAALALDPANANRLYAVSGREGVYRTDNGGVSWAQISTADLEALVHGGKLIVSPTNPNLLLLAAKAGVRRSTDGGVTWPIALGGGTPTGLVMDPANPNRLYAALYHETDATVAGVYTSGDGGANWTKLQGCPGAGLPAATAKARITLAISGSKLFAGYKPADRFQLYRTTNQTCTVATPTGPQTEPRWEAGWLTTTDHPVLWSGLYADPTNAQYLYLGGTDFWRSTDGGTTFARSSGYSTVSGSAHADHHAFAVDPTNAAIIYTLGDGGIYRSPNHGQPGSWSFIGDGLRIGEFYDIALARTDAALVIGGAQDNGTLKYDSTSAVWKMILGGDGATVDFDPTSGQVLYAMHQYADSIKRSANGGGSLQGIAGGLPTGSICFNLHFQVDPGTPTTLLASCSHTCSGGKCQGGLWRTTNPGSAWSTLFTPAAGGVNRSAVDASVNLYYVGVNNGRLYAGPGGANWQEVFVSPVGGAGINDIEVDLDDPRTVYVALARTGVGRIFRLRRDSAQPATMTAVDITSDLPTSLRVNALAVDRMRPLTLFAGTHKGVYQGRSFDNGATWTWTLYANGMPPAADIRDLEAHPTTGVLRAATYGRGVYEVYPDFPIGSTLAAEGKLTFLRVHDVGTGWGPSDDFLDVEVVLRLDSAPGRAFGFQLRTDANEGARHGMLDLLRDAFNQDRRVRVDYVRTGLDNGRVLRVMVLP